MQSNLCVFSSYVENQEPQEQVKLLVDDTHLKVQPLYHLYTCSPPRVSAHTRTGFGLFQNIFVLFCVFRRCAGS